MLVQNAIRPIYIHRLGAVPVTLDPAYIRRWRHITDEYIPRIFIADVTEPMNIWGGGSKSNQTIHIFVGVPHIFVGLVTDEYNLNYIRCYRRI
jgi:hypothetical protein